MSIDADAEQKVFDSVYEDKTPETPNEEQTTEEPTDEDVTESGGDEEAESAEEEGGEQEGTALINFLKEHFGEDLSHYGNDYEALKALINARKLVGKREEDAILAKRLRERFGDDYIEKLLSEEGPPQQQVNPEEIQKQWQQAMADIVEWNDDWLKEVYRDEEGKLVPMPGADKDVVDKIMRFVKHRDKIVNEFAKNPRRFFYYHLQEFMPIIKSMILQDVQEIQKTQVKQQEAVNWVTQNASILFENGDPEAGLTPLGEEIIELAATFMEAGVQDKEAAIRKAGEFTLQRKQMQAPKPKTELYATPPKRKNVPKARPRTIAQIIEEDGVSISEAIERYRKEQGLL